FQRASELFMSFNSENLPLELSYSPSMAHWTDPETLRQAFLQEFEKKRPQELHFGMTLIGPHRDDLMIKIGSKAAREYASIGQSALAACALRLAEWFYLKEETTSRPLMIVDDFGFSLDSTKRKRLFSELTNLGQLFLSTHSPLHDHPSKKTIAMKEGQIII